jgi:hypothetical protein
MDTTQLVTTGITSITAIVVAIIGFYAIRAEKGINRAEKNIKKISGNLPSWELLFEHDENGNLIEGSIERLIEATLKGYPIKIRIHHSDTDVEVIDAQSLSVDNKKIFASNTSLISTTKDASGDHVYQDNTYHYYVIAGSNGMFHQKRINIDGTPRNSTKIKRHMAWIGLMPASLK